MYQKKEIKIFLNSMNSWFSNFFIEELRTDYLPKSKIQYSFMGTTDNSDRPLPYLFEPKLTSIEIGYNYDQEIFENDIIIFNLNDSNLEEVEFVIRGLQTLKYSTKKMLIIISNIMTWANTPLKSYTDDEILKYSLTNEEEIPEDINEKINVNNHIENESKISDNLYSVNEDENNEGEIKEIINDRKSNFNNKENSKNIKDEIKEIKEENEEENELNEESEKNNEIINNEQKDIDEQLNEQNKKNVKKIYYYKEEDYPTRIPSPQYYNFKILETLALQVKNPNLKAYVVCPGFIYGYGEDFFFDYFRKSWLGGVEYFPIRGNGYNYIPTIHILDLAHIIKRIMDLKPDIKYIFACDKTKNPFMRNIISSITNNIGGIDIKPIKEYNIDEMEIINYGELKINLPMKTSPFLNDEKRVMGESLEDYNKRIFNWHCEGGIEENITLLIKEFKLYRDIKPVRIIINGPPSSGKMTIAKILSEKYKLNIYNIKTICEWADKLGEDKPLGKEIKEKREEIEEAVKKAIDDYDHRKNKKKSDPPLDTHSLRKFPPEFINKLVKAKISSGECLIKGYILVNYPKNYNDCINLFSSESNKKKENEENNDNNNNNEIKEKEGENNNEEVEEKEIIKSLLPENILVINNYTEESLKGKLQKNPEYNEKQQEFDSRFNRRFETYKKDNELQDAGQTKILEDFYKENNINIIYVNESNYMENKEGTEKQIIENLESNGVVNNYSKLFDEEDEVVYLKPIIEKPNENELNENILNLEEDENNQNIKNNIGLEDKSPINIEDIKKKNNETIKEDESEESAVRIEKKHKKKNDHNVSKTKLKLKKEKEKEKALEKQKTIEKKDKDKDKDKEKDKNTINETIEKDNNHINKNYKKKVSAFKEFAKKNLNPKIIKVEKTVEEQLNDLKMREQNLLEKKSEVLRRYISENIMPLLAKGVLYVCHNLPDDPVEALANFLMENSFDLQKDSDKPIGELEKIMQETEH